MHGSGNSPFSYALHRCGFVKPVQPAHKRVALSIAFILKKTLACSSDVVMIEEGGVPQSDISNKQAGYNRPP